MKTEATRLQANHRYPDLPAGKMEATYCQGTVDGSRGDSWRLQWIAHMLPGDVGA